jgi:hypothetical protein
VKDYAAIQSRTTAAGGEAAEKAVAASGDLICFDLKLDFKSYGLILGFCMANDYNLLGYSFTPGILRGHAGYTRSLSRLA